MSQRSRTDLCGGRLATAGASAMVFTGPGLYSCNRKGHPLRGEMGTPPWSLAKADYTGQINTMARPLGLELTGDPHMLITKPVDVRVWTVRRCTDE